MINEQKKFQKELETLKNSIQTFSSTEDNKRVLELGNTYKSDRNRIHNEILKQYDDLFAVIQSIRKLAVLGVQNVELQFNKNEDDCKNCINRYKAVNPLLLKYIDVFDEIICLMEHGFPDGAMQRWRTFLEYSIIVIFILEQGEEIAEAYNRNFIDTIKDDFKPRTNYAWAKGANCFKDNKQQISIKKILENINGIDHDLKKLLLSLYTFTSQSIHGSSFGIKISFNDDMTIKANDLHEKNADYYSGGISTVISNAMILLNQTFIHYFNTFPDGGLDIKKLWNALQVEYVKIYMHLFQPTEGVNIRIQEY